MKRILLLCRQSLTRKDGDSVSIAQQRETLTRHYEQADAKVVGVIEQENTRAWKTKLGDRADLGQVMDLARKDAFDVLAVYDVSRLARRVSVIETIAEDLGDLGKAVESLREPWVSDPFLRQLAGGIAQRQSAELSARMKHVWQHRAARGQYHGRAPVGYVKVDGRLIPDPDVNRTALVQEAFDRYLAGEGSTIIARDFRLRTGERWTARRVLTLLANPAYVGTATVGDVVQAGAHEPIVAPGTFRCVQEALSERRAPKSGLSLSWLSGLVWCGCGQPMYPVRIAKRKNGRAYHADLFRCRWAGEPQRCSQERKSIAIRAVENAVVAQLAADLERASVADPGEVAKRMQAEQKRRHPDWPKRERELRREVDKLQRQRAAVVEMRQDLLVSREEAVARIKPIDAKIAGLEKDLAAGPAPVDLGGLVRVHRAATGMAEDIAVATEDDPGWLRGVLHELGARVVARDGVPGIVYPTELAALVG